MNELSPADRVFIHQRMLIMETYLKHLRTRFHSLLCKAAGVCIYDLYR